MRCCKFLEIRLITTCRGITRVLGLDIKLFGLHFSHWVYDCPFNPYKNMTRDSANIQIPNPSTHSLPVPLVRRPEALRPPPWFFVGNEGGYGDFYKELA